MADPKPSPAPPPNSPIQPKAQETMTDKTNKESPSSPASTPKLEAENDKSPPSSKEAKTGPYTSIVNDAFKTSSLGLTNITIPQLNQSVRLSAEELLQSKQKEKTGKRKEGPDGEDRNVSKKVHFADTQDDTVKTLETPHLTQESYQGQQPLRPHHARFPQEAFQTQQPPLVQPHRLNYAQRYEPYTSPSTMPLSGVASYAHSPQHPVYPFYNGIGPQPYLSPNVPQFAPTPAQPGVFDLPLLAPGKGHDNPAVHAFIGISISSRISFQIDPYMTDSNLAHIQHLLDTVPVQLQKVFEEASRKAEEFEVAERAKCEAHRKKVLEAFSIAPLAANWRSSFVPEKKVEVLARMGKVISELRKIDDEIRELCGGEKIISKEEKEEDGKISGEAAWEKIAEEVKELGRKATKDFKTVDKVCPCGVAVVIPARKELMGAETRE